MLAPFWRERGSALLDPPKIPTQSALRPLRHSPAEGILEALRLDPDTCELSPAPTSHQPSLGSAHPQENSSDNCTQPPLPPQTTVFGSTHTSSHSSSVRLGSSPKDISILSRFSLLRAFGGAGGVVAVAPINRVLNRFMAGDVENSQTRRPEAEACHLPLTHADYPHRESAHACWRRPRPPTRVWRRGRWGP